MRRYRYGFVVLIAIALLSGCASMGRVTGFTVQEREGFGVQEPWHNLVLKGNVPEKAVAVAYVPLPQPIPPRWQNEFTLIRNISDSPQGGPRLFKKRVFRALVFREESFVGMFDAVLNPARTGFFVLFPSDGGTYVGMGNNLVILSSDAKWLMTTKSEIVDLSVGQSLMELPQEFFREHPSALPQVVNMRRGDKSGKKFFADLESMFPRRLVAHGKLYSGSHDIKTAIGLTAENNAVDRIISCGSLPVSMAMITPIGAGISLGAAVVRDVYAASKGCE